MMQPTLPMIHRLITILFCLSLLFAGVVGSTSLWLSRVATQRCQSALSETAALQKKIGETKASRSELEKNIREAADLENWVLASLPMQPLVAGIIHSMGADATIVDLGIERDPETPPQLRLALTLNNASDKQMDTTLQAIRQLNYRERSPSQSMERGNVDYRASLVWRKPEKP